MTGNRHLRLVLALCAAVTTWAASTLALARPARADAATVAAASHAGFSPGAGILWESDADLARDLDAMAATGASWIRLDFAWSSIEATRAVFSWSATDRVVDAARARGLQVIALPAYTPAWARPAGTTDKHPPTDHTAFAGFVRAAAQRYADRVKVWEIWNEPNISPFWAPKPDPAAYTALLRAASAAVRGVDPGATVVSAGLSPATDAVDGSQVAPATFLAKVYAAGGGPSFDAVGMHPYSYPARPMDPTTAAWNTFYRLPLVHDVMVANGDAAKKIWSTEYGAPTGSSAQAVSEAEQAALVTEAYEAIVQWPWAGPLLWYAHRDAGTDRADREQNFGLLRQDFSAKPALDAFTVAVAARVSAPVAPIKVSPTTAVVEKGTRGGGGAAALAADDNVYFRVSSASRVASWYAAFPTVANSLTRLSVTYRGKHSRTCSQTVAIWNWTTKTWTTLDTRSAGTTEAGLAGLSPTGALGDFVSGDVGDGAVRVRVSCKARSGSFTTRGDLLQLEVL